MTRKIKNLIKDFSISSFNYSGGMGGGEAGVAEDLLTTKGDTHGFSTENARVAIGSNTQVLTADSTEVLGLKWATPTDIAPPTTTKGDLSGFSTLQARIPIGVDATVLTADSTQALGLAWAAAGGGIEYNQMTTVTTFSPTQQTGLAKVTVDRTDSSDTAGLVDVVVDGSVLETVSPTEFYNSILNPATSLAITSRNIAWDLASSVYDSTFSVSAQNNTPEDMKFNDDGTEMYMLGQTGSRVYQYTLSTAWDISTASYVTSYAFSSLPTSTGIAFKTDGTKMYVMGRSNDYIQQYSLSTAWDLSTTSYDSISISMPGNPSGIVFKPDGLKMYITDWGTDTIKQYTLSTAWNVSTATYDSVSHTYTAQSSTPRDSMFKPDGLKLFMIGDNTVFQYSLSSAWDVSTVSYDSISFSVSAQDTNTRALGFKTDGTKMYTIGGTNDSVYQYTMESDFDGPTRISIG